MRVLHVISDMDPRSGGPAVGTAGLVTAQANAGMKVSIASTYGSPQPVPVPASFETAGVAMHQIGPTHGRLKRHPLLRSTLEQLIAATDIVHIHTLWEEIQHVASTIAFRLDKPYVITPHGMLDPWSLRQSRWKKKLYIIWRLRRDLNHAATIHYTAVAERDGAARLDLRPPAIVEPNGVDLEAYQYLPRRGEFRRRFGIDPNRPLALFLSRIHHKKGLDLLIPAFAQIVSGERTGEGPMLAIVGPDEGGYQAKVERMIDEHCLRDRVVWTGMLQGVDKVQAYVDSDLFVLPSYQENFGIVVAEAMAAGTPVIISDKVNLDRDVLAAGAGGVVPTEVEPLAAAMREWLADSEKRRIAGIAGRKYAFERFSWDAIALRWQNHYNHLLGNRL